MSLRHDIQVNVNGIYVKGAIKNGEFISNNLINTGSKTFSQHFIQKVIKELQELEQLMESVKITHNLSETDNIFTTDDWDPL